MAGKVITVRLPQETWEKLEAKAKELDLLPSEMARELLRQALKVEPPKQKPTAKVKQTRPKIIAEKQKTTADKKSEEDRFEPWRFLLS
jgi:hypothetical protein